MLGRKAIGEHRVPLVFKVRWVLAACKEIQVRMVHKANEARKVLKVFRDKSVSRATMEHKACKGHAAP